MRTLYQDAIEQLAPDTIDHHATDLYLKDTTAARALLAEHDKKGKRVYQVDGWNVSRLTSQIDGAQWLDIPFAYDPGWRCEKVPADEGSDPHSEQSIQGL